MTNDLTQQELEWAQEQIILWIDNDRSYYNRKIAIFKNLEKKKNKGTYDPDKALKAFNNLSTEVRRMLNRKERENIINMIGTTMPTITSSMADTELRDEFGAWYTEAKELRSS